MDNKGISWGWIFLCLIVFWPVGLYLLFRKISSDKSVIMSGKTKRLKITAWILIIIAGFGLIGSIESGADDTATSLLIMLAFLVGGILLLKKSKKMDKVAKKYMNYITLIINEKQTSIDYIANITTQKYEVVVEDLKQMILLGYLPKIELDLNERRIIFKDQKVTQAAPVNATTKIRTIRCPGCGANNVVKTDDVHECEYCGTPLVG
ncbi:MAG: hypothetical protein LBL91_04645 [Lachnospiraceae bacterium]|jgi:hypothetical protein|nr:hypothetical protein [Lachnospiraceae bacterium]